jgi:hypothetical protein
MAIKHSVVTEKANNPAYDVSADAWNAAHTIDDLTIALSKLVQEVQNLINNALQKSGGELIGNLSIQKANAIITLWDGDPDHKVFLNAEDGNLSFSTAGGRIIMETELELSGLPTESYHAANKEYVDTVAGSLAVTTTEQTGNRGLGTVYQNTTGKPLMVYVSLVTGEAGVNVSLLIGLTSPPTITLDTLTPPDVWEATVQGIVPPNWYYKVSISGPATLEAWIEQTLGT